MSKQNKQIIGMLAAFVVVVLCSYFAILNRDFVSKIGTVVTPPPPDPLEEKLNEAALLYKNGDLSVIQMQSITTFLWDRLYIFGNYVDTSRLDSVVGSSWRDNDNCFHPVNKVSHSEGYTLLIFSHQGVVIYCLAHENHTYDLFVPSKGFDEAGYSPEEALFVVSETGRLILKENK